MIQCAIGSVDFFTQIHGIVLYLNILGSRITCENATTALMTSKKDNEQKFTSTFGSRKLRSFILFSAPISLILHWQWIPLYFLRCFQYEFTHWSGMTFAILKKKDRFALTGFIFSLTFCKDLTAMLHEITTNIPYHLYFHLFHYAYDVK